MQLRCHLCSAPSFRTSFHSPQKKRKGVKDLVSELPAVPWPCLAYIYSSHLIPKAPSNTLPCLSLLHTSTLITHPSLSLFSLPRLTCFPPPPRGGAEWGVLWGGVLDSVTHRGAGAAAFAILRPSPHAARPPGLYSVTAAL